MGRGFKSLADQMALMPADTKNKNLEDLCLNITPIDSIMLYDLQGLSFISQPNKSIKDWKDQQKRDK
tara:strand:- start:42 stop:242 length:201 start_codon:yes stop_codon:yes gene_type:complete